MRWAVLIIILIALLLHGSKGGAQEIVLLRGRQAHPQEEQQWRELSQFFGLNLREVESNTERRQPRRLLPGPALRTLAVLVPADALSGRTEWIESALREAGAQVPLLIFDVTAQTDTTSLARWSAGRVTDCAPAAPRAAPRLLRFAAEPGFAGQLAGKDLPAVADTACRLEQHGVPVLHPLLATVSGMEVSAALAVVRRSDRDVYFAPRLELSDRSWQGRSDGRQAAFSYLAPGILFLKHAAGSYAWHLDAPYANLTIDDPWLTEPYGNLNYATLLSQMQSHRFHTTIAFIPRNYDRNTLEMTALFRQHPDLFSICVHGNNHQHREFGDYSQNPLDVQLHNVRQSIARMNEMERLTGLPYDRFMVFPHGVAPLPTFALLQKYGFLGTANSLNVPLGETSPTDPLYPLRPYTKDYSGLLSMSRLSVEAPIAPGNLSILAFLGEPILLYGHQEAFRDGGAHILEVVDSVNALAPHTQWAGLGTIARHLYQVRQQGEARYSVRMLSSEAAIRNSTGRTATFDVALPVQSDAISEFSVDGVAHQSSKREPVITLSLLLSPGQEKSIRVRYADQVEVENESIQRKGWGVSLTRDAAEFRDRWLSSHRWGQSVVGAYYQHDGERLEFKLEHLWAPLLAVAATLTALIAWAVVSFGRGSKRKASAPLPRSLL